MKVVIIGGGIAGLTIASLMRRKKWDVVVCERSSEIFNRGHAFLMHSEGLSTIQDLGIPSKNELKCEKINFFSLKNVNGREIKHVQLDAWYCIKRVDLIQYLYDLLPYEVVVEGREFSHFIYDEGKAIAAVFTNGQVEYGDLFIGADGANSKVRETIYDNIEFTPTEVKEIVGVAKFNLAQDPNGHTFRKYQKKDASIAFGYIPASDAETVWFIQYDANRYNLKENNTPALEAFTKELVKDFPKDVQAIIEANNFCSTYIWNTRDFDLLPSFHKSNVVLIGDAAHQALPFTSAGTTNAITDAHTLVQCLSTYDNMEQAFTKYYQQRAEEVNNHIQLGRTLKDIFLHPGNIDDYNVPVPLIVKKHKAKPNKHKKVVTITYFTDPICSTCWIIQPLLRKLKLEYEEHIELEYRMGGLLPSWENYDKGIIKKPSDAAQHWEEVSARTEMPLDGDVWLEDPLHSSYPPSIAFKAAQIQDNDKAILFLRRLQELVFLDKKNITKWEYIEHAALNSGLDSARLLLDMPKKGRMQFQEDLSLAKKLNVSVFPTLFFSVGPENFVILKGFQPYEKFEEVLMELIPDIQK
jgi:2-polyprenyl-6-methoxyphenol hydroxylase-like FAD-dependent oxidoreductase/predicted DsbA family dithiol-disulfide isomerase